MVVFLWALCNNNSLLISRTLLIILVDLKIKWSGRSEYILWFSVPKSFLQTFEDRSKCTINNSYNRHSQVPFFQFSGKVRVFVSLFTFIYFSLCLPERKTPWCIKFFIFILNTRSSLLDGIRWSNCIAKSRRILCVSFSGLVGRVFANGPGDLGSVPGCVIPKT